MRAPPRPPLHRENTLLLFGLFVCGVSLIEGDPATRHLLAFMVAFTVGLVVGRRP